MMHVAAVQVWDANPQADFMLCWSWGTSHPAPYGWVCLTSSIRQVNLINNQALCAQSSEDVCIVHVTESLILVSVWLYGYMFAYI